MRDEVYRLVEHIAKPFESCSLKAYWDPVGYPTQGWGRLLIKRAKSEYVKDFVNQGMTPSNASFAADNWLQTRYPRISQAVADDWFRADVKVANNGVLKYTEVYLTPEMEAALTDFTFNVGIGNYQISTLRRLINHGEFWEASQEFKKWNKAGGIILKGLTRRREAERVMFIMGIYK